MSDLEKTYHYRFRTVLVPLAHAIELQLQRDMEGEPRIDRISARPKSVGKFLRKAAKVLEDGQPKYTEPLRQIQDQIGARIVTFYPSDVARIKGVVEKYYRPIEQQNLVPESEWEFGYFGLHYVLLLPSDILDPAVGASLRPEFFELQIKTLFQHAWSEANHDLGYKPDATPLSPGDQRLLALASAQSWGADRIFEELFQERERLAATGG